MINTARYAKDNSVNLQRRTLMQGVGAAAAVAIAGPALSGSSEELNLAETGMASAELSGRVISQVGVPVKTLILRNESDESVNIEHFVNGGLMFDGEVLDCNGACMNTPVTLSSKKEMLVQFDKRYLYNHDARAKAHLNVQSNVQRMSAGTRVVEISGSVSNGIVTLVPSSDVVS